MKWTLIFLYLFFIACERQPITVESSDKEIAIFLDEDSYDIESKELPRVRNSEFPEDIFNSVVIRTTRVRHNIIPQISHYRHYVSVGTEFQDDFVDFGNIKIETIPLNTIDSLNVGKPTNHVFSFKGSLNSNLFALELMNLGDNTNSREMTFSLSNSNFFQDQDIDFKIFQGLELLIPGNFEISISHDFTIQLNHNLDPRKSIVTIIYEKPGSPIKYGFKNFVSYRYTRQIRIPKEHLKDIYENMNKDAPIRIFVAEKVKVGEINLKRQNNETIIMPVLRDNRYIITLNLVKIQDV